MFANGNGLSIGLLVVGCMLAIGLLLAQWFNPPSLDETTVRSGKASVSELAITPAQPFRIAPLDDYGEIVERPLFLAERRPPEETPEETPVSETPVGDEELLLLGVVLAPDVNMALLQVDKRGKIARLRVGEQVNGWALKSVQADRVNLNNGQKDLDLLLLRNRPKASSKSRQPRRNRRRNYRTKESHDEEDYLESDISHYR